MSTLFISHSSRDNDAAKELSRRLAEPPRNHHSVFLDLDPAQGIVAGQSWEQTLYRKLRSCRAVIALITEPYLDSQWCFAEIALARMEGKHIFALLVDPLGSEAKLPGILTEKQFIDLRQDPDDGYRRLWKGLEELDLLGVAGEWDPKESPYLGLRAYDERHAAVFFGRNAEIQLGVELLDRGAPGLIMVLGSSGSGKSSLVRAGMVPRLRRNPDRWMVADPFRPRRDPVAELVESLASAYQRYAPDQATREGSKDRIREKLEAGLPRAKVDDSENAADSGDGEATTPPNADVRLRHLLSKLEELRQSPPEGAGPPVMKFLDWSLDDLRRICGVEPLAPTAAARAPQSSPLVEIADHLRRASEHQNARVLLIVDQFEELLGLDEPEERTQRLLTLLRYSVEIEHSPLMLLGTMRSDFLGLFQRNRALREVDFESLSVGPMNADSMRRVIEEPAKLAAIELEQGLADRLLEDTETPDALPLLSFTLWRLWEDRKDGKLSVGQYEALGGLHGAIAREAEAVLGLARRQGQEDDVRTAFLQMARLSEDGSYARQPVSWDREELQKVKPILDAFEQRRLLVTRQEEGDSSTLEVAHEALFRSWPPLVSWLDNNRAELLLKQQIRRDAQAWDDSDRAAEHLWRGGRLQQAAELSNRGELGGLTGTTNVAALFVRAGLWRRAIRRCIAIGIAALFFLVLGAGLYFTNEAKNEAQHALARAYMMDANRLINSGQWQEALAYLARANRLDPVGSGASRRITDLLLRLARPIPAEPFEHKQDVRFAAFSPDGRLVVTASDDKTAKVWDAKTGELLSTFEEHVKGVRSANFRPDGKYVVTASDDKTARVWNAKDGTVIHKLDHTDEVRYADFSPDGLSIVTASRDGTAQVWDVKKKKAEHKKPFKGPGGQVWHAVFSPDGKYVVTAPDNKVAQVWSTDGSLIHDLEHNRKVLSATFSPDGKSIVTVSEDETSPVCFWDASNGVQDECWELTKGVNTASFSPDGRSIVTASDDNTAKVWNAKTRVLLSEFLDHEDNVNNASFNPDGRSIVTASDDDTVRVWASAAGSALFTEPLEIELKNGAHFTAFSPNGQSVVTVFGRINELARVWNAKSGETIAEFLKHKFKINYAALSPDGKRIVTASVNEAWVWNADDGNEIDKLDHNGDVLLATFSPDGERIVTASGKEVRVWNAEDGNEIHKLVHNGTVLLAIFNPDGKRIVTASGKEVRVWNSEDGNEILKLDHNGDVLLATFSPDGKRIVTASGQEVRVWNAEDGAFVTEVKHDGKVNSATFSPDGQRIVTASDDKTARIWKAPEAPLAEYMEHEDWVPAATMEHEDWVRAASFSLDGRSVVTASEDQTARVWDTDTGIPLSEPLEHDQRVFSAAFSPDGRRLVTDSDYSVRVWDMQMGWFPQTNRIAQFGDRSDADLLSELAEVSAGYELSSTGFPIRITAQQDRLGELLELTQGAPEGGSGAASFARWFLTDSWERTISPLSKITVEEWIERRLDTVEGRREAKLAFPGHPRLREAAATTRSASSP